MNTDIKPVSTENERELWNKAIKKGNTSRIADRMFQVVIGSLLVVILVYIGYTQAQYQEQSRRITRERNEQMQQILQSNEETKAYIRCAVRFRGTHQASDLKTLKDCVITDTVVLKPLE